MNRFWVGSAALLTCLSTLLAAAVGIDYGERIDVDGRRLRLKVMGQGAPVVVLESSGMAPLEGWARVQPEAAKFARVVAYDHAGYWSSEPGPKPRDARRVAEDLRALLRRAELPPPYVLVGYSFGGPFIRVFAHRYPGEVAGMLFVDPSQEEAFEWLKVHHPEINRITPEEEAGQDEWGCTWASLEQARRAWPLPGVPVTLITCVRHGGDPLLREVMPVWLKSHQEWLSKVPNARHVVTEKSGHGIIFQEPGLVVETIRDMVEEISRKDAKAQRLFAPLRLCVRSPYLGALMSRQ
jgi:pimeloyl-ACP methyl ester carboxylesterase